jgi:hypothetical protein
VLHAVIEFFPSDSIVEPLTLLNIALVITQAIAQQHSAALDVLTRVGLPVWVTRFLALFVVILWDNLHTACSPVFGFLASGFQLLSPCMMHHIQA